MSLALDTILGDVESFLEVVVEVDSAKRSDGTLKTWYFSTHFRSTGGAETPANTEFLPFLSLGSVIGPLSQSLAEDMLFSGLASNNPGTVTIVQTNPIPDELSQLNDYVFAGYKLRIKIGRVIDLYSAFETLRTTTVDIDPVIQSTGGGLQAIFQLAGALTRMINEPLIVKRYVGIPTCGEVLTLTGVASTVYNAAFDVRTFTIVYRVRVVSASAANRTLMRKFGSVTSTNFILNFNTTGFIECFASLAGTLTSLMISSTNLIDSKFHTIVWSLYDRQTTYLMIDGEVVATFIPSASVDLPANGIDLARNLVGKHSDARLYNRYMTPEEARAISSVRSDGLDYGCVGCWRFDDGGSATSVHNYSATGVNATWAGVLNTDYKWSETDLGEPEQAGRPYPLTVGDILNAHAPLIDGFRERYRGNVDATGWFSASSNSTLTVKSQGTTLTGGGVDYTAPASGGDGVFSMTTQQDEPVTFDLRNTGGNEELIYPSLLAQSILTNRTRLTASDIDNQNPTSLLCPWPSGYWTDQDTTAQQVLNDILGQSGMYYRETSLGSLWIDMLIPPTGYGPYNQPCLDLGGYLNAGVQFGDIGDISSSCTISCWVKVNIADQTAYNFGASEPNVGTCYLAAKSNLSGNYAFYFQSIGTNAGKLGFRIAGVTHTSQAGVIAPFVWYFVAAVFDDSANTMKIYSAPFGGTLIDMPTTTNSGTPTTDNNNLRIGGNGYPWCSVQHLQIFDRAKTMGQLQTIMTNGPTGSEQGLIVYASLTEGNGNPIESIGGSTGVIFGSTSFLPKWCPKLVIDLDDTPSVRLTDFHHTHPAGDLIVKYAKNRFPMSSSDIDTGVSQNVRISLMNEWKDVRIENTAIKNRYKNSKKILLESPFVDTESASRLLRILASRFGTNNYIGSLNFPPGLSQSRMACGLEIGDEIGIKGTIPSQLQTARSFRVVSVAPNPLKLETTVVFNG